MQAGDGQARRTRWEGEPGPLQTRVAMLGSRPRHHAEPLKTQAGAGQSSLRGARCHPCPPAGAQVSRWPRPSPVCVAPGVHSLPAQGSAQPAAFAPPAPLPGRRPVRTSSDTPSQWRLRPPLWSVALLTARRVTELPVHEPICRAPEGGGWCTAVSPARRTRSVNSCRRAGGHLDVRFARREPRVSAIRPQHTGACRDESQIDLLNQRRNE